MSSDVYLMQGKKGLTAFITGVRANESMIRYRSLVQKLHENYIASPYKLSKKIPLRLAKPIYDWETDDVFKFIHEEHNAEYCSYYDVAAMTGSNTRVGIPLHSVAIRRIGDVIATEPEFYDRLVTVFPYIDAQRRLWKDIDTDVIINRYASKGFDGAGAFIENYMIGEHNKKRARSFVAEFRRKQAKDPRSYTMYQLIRTMLLNEMSPRISASPIGPKTKVHRVREMDIVDEN
jgi:3'-phosphoadenosine 5'-phosphosulfate sulfotransferase (PAPS reductase)/FAD synthetase